MIEIPCCEILITYDCVELRSVAMHQPMTVIGSDMTRHDSRTVKIVQFLVYGYTRHFLLVIADEEQWISSPIFTPLFSEG
jgi:hypothetical protein